MKRNLVGELIQHADDWTIPVYSEYDDEKTYLSWYLGTIERGDIFTVLEHTKLDNKLHVIRIMVAGEKSYMGWIELMAPGRLINDLKWIVL